MNTDRGSSIWLFVLIAALPFFLFMSFRYAFDAQNEQRALQRQAYTDSQLVMARSDAVLGEALAVSKAFAVDEAIRSGNAQTDELIQLTLLDMTPLKDVPPSSMRPMQLRLSNRS